MIKKSMDESNQGFMKHLGGLELKKVSETQFEFNKPNLSCLKLNDFPPPCTYNIPSNKMHDTVASDT